MRGENGQIRRWVRYCARHWAQRQEAAGEAPASRDARGGRDDPKETQRGQAPTEGRNPDFPEDPAPISVLAGYDLVTPGWAGRDGETAQDNDPNPAHLLE